MRVCRNLAALGAALLIAAAAPASPLTVTVFDGTGAPVADAVVAVYLKGIRSRAAAGASAEIAQRDRQFLPSITAVQTGTPVLFPNLDTVRHHVYSFSPTQRFEIKLYAGVPSVPVVFDKPGTGALGCNIHDKMSAWIHVVDTPLFGKTNAAGQVVLEVPAGEHQLQAWSAALAETTPPLLQPLPMGAAAQALAVRLPAPRGS
jgi:plastocyanin